MLMTNVKPKTWSIDLFLISKSQITTEEILE